MSDAIQWRSRIRLVDEVVGVLRERILSGYYESGAPLRQELIAAELNISRTPLREALRMLESEGLVSVSPGRGARVIAGDRQRLLAAYQVREVLDGLAARLLATRRDGADFSLLGDWIDKQRQALEPWQPRAYTTANVGFHQAIVEMSGNEYVIAQLPVVHMTSLVFMPFEVVEHGRATTAVREHEDILAAIKAGRGEEAERLARGHVHRTIESLVQQAATEAGRPERD